MKKKVLYLLKKWRTYIIKHPQVKPHFNGNRLIDRTTLETIGWYAFGLLWLLTAIEMVKSYICNNIKEDVDAFFVISEAYLADNWWVNLMITVTCLLLFAFWLKHVWDDRYLSIKRMTIALCIISILSFAGTFTNVHSAFKIDYAALCWYLLFVQLLLDLRKLWYKRWNVKVPSKAKLIYYRTPKREP